MANILNNLEWPLFCHADTCVLNLLPATRTHGLSLWPLRAGCTCNPRFRLLNPYASLTTTHQRWPLDTLTCTRQPPIYRSLPLQMSIFSSMTWSGSLTLHGYIVYVVLNNYHGHQVIYSFSYHLHGIYLSLGFFHGTHTHIPK
ncbi:hypothetical protein EV401DRAFT_14695 [Pisolithus croceorrhizus]|nr:hypothetical protein EV401DRAFT_14695 [Pisolithus croceorrhizus]